MVERRVENLHSESFKFMDKLQLFLGRVSYKEYGGEG